MNTTIPLPPPSPQPASPPPRPGEPSPRTGPLGASGVAWRLFAGLLIVGGLVWGTLQLITVLAHEERVETETFAAAGIDALSVESANGWVRIIAADTDEVTVRAEISDGLRATGESREVVDGTLTLTVDCPNVGSDFCWANYEVTVPRDLPITAHADNGRIEVRGSDADLAINGDNGSVALDDVGGVLDVSTDNGRVEATGVRSTQVVADSDNGSVLLDFDVTPETVRATTENGRVEVAVPNDGTAYRVDLSSGNGREELLLPTDPGATRSLVLRTDNGTVTARTS